MTNGELIDTSLRIYQRTAWTILKLTSVPMLLCYAGIVFLQSVVVPGLLSTQSKGPVANEMSELVAVLSVGLFIAGPLFCLGLGWATGVIVSVTRSLLHGVTLDVDAAQEAGKRAIVSVGRALILVICTGLIGIGIAGVFLLLGMNLEKQKGLGELGALAAAMVGITALAFGLIALPFAWNSRALVPVVTVIESLGPKEAVRRSKRLMSYVRGQTSATSLTVSVAAILGLVGLPLWFSLAGVIEMTHAGEWLASAETLRGLGQMFEGLIDGIPAYVSLWLLLPLWSIAMTVLYYDRIVRIEAYDVKLILEDTQRETHRSVLLR